MSGATRRAAIASSATLGVALVAVLTANSVHWVGRTFPGFFVMRNRVVASVTLAGWLPVDPARVFQHQVVAVDGVALDASTAVYAAVERRGPGATVRYTLRAPDGTLHEELVPARRFSGWDYARVFAAYLLTGVAFVATGLVVFFLQPESAAARGLLSCGVSIGLFALTGTDLYGPHWFFRLHVAAETMAPAALLHLALVFPTDRLRGRSWTALLAVYAPCALLTAVYELALGSPSRYTTAHLAAVSAQGLGAGAVIVSTAWAFVASRAPLVRRRIGVVALGAFAGFLVPGAISAASTLIGGVVPVNFAAFTVFLFPVSVGYAILRRDLFEIDAVLRHAIAYVVVALTIGTAYAILILLAGLLIPTGELVANAPFVLGVMNTMLVFLVVPLRARTQSAVDRLFFRHPYDGDGALAALGTALSAVETFAAVAAAADAALARTLAPTHVALRLREDDDAFQRHGGKDPADDRAVVLASDLVERLGAGDVLARYAWDDGSGRPLPPPWDALDAELLVPIRAARGLVGVLVLGRRRSGRAYVAPDVAFLRNVASQMALGIEDVGLLQRLEQKQASLMRADRLATLGRLASGLAHEMGSPIGAVLSSLRILDQLGREYADSIDVPTVTAENHREIAGEMIATARKATEWAESEVGAGSCFTLTLPVPAADVAAARTGGADAATAHPDHAARIARVA